MNLTFRKFSETNDFAQQRELYRECFPESVDQPTETTDHYFWKFSLSPIAPASYQYGAYLDSDLVGYYAAIPFRYRINNQTILGGMVCDVMTGKKARGKGVFTKLGVYSTECMQGAGLDFAIGYPIRPEVIPGHLKAGWTIVQRMPIYVKVLRTNTILRSCHIAWLAPLANTVVKFFTWINALKKNRNYNAFNLSLDELLSSKWYPTFHNEWSASATNSLIKDIKFLRWRLGAPGASYRIFCARSSSGTPVGLCIARSTILGGVPTVAVLDIMILPGHKESFNVIDAALIDFAKQKKSDLIATMISPNWARRYNLFSRLYIKSPHVFSLIVKKLNPAIPNDCLLSPSPWHTMWIDSDDL